MASPYGHTQVVNVGDNVKVRIREHAQYIVKAASTANIADLTAASSTVDGVSCADGDVILLKDQSSGAENGPYAFSGISGGSGVLTRVPPITDELEIFPGVEFYVEQGTVNANRVYKLSTTGAITVDTTALTFKLMSADLSSTSANDGASLIGIEDSAGVFTATTVEGALAELRALVNAYEIPISLYAWREVSSGGDVANVAGIGGHLASDTTPILRGDAAESQEISWATGNADLIAVHLTLPSTFNGAQDVTLDLWVSSGATDAATFTVETGWDGGALVSDTADDSATKSATKHKITATIAAADIPNSAQFVTIILTPAAHASDTIQLHGARLNVKKS